MASTTKQSPFLTALMEHRVSAKVTDTDHCRIRGGMAVETDYIILVEPQEDVKKDKNETVVAFDPFALSKTYSAFRSLAIQLKKAADTYTKHAGDELPPDAVKVAKYCELVKHLIDSQKTQYLGKVNYNYVKVLSNKRSQILNDTLQATVNYFPEKIEDTHPLVEEVASMLETFFLTDHCGMDPSIRKISRKSSMDEKDNLNPLAWLPFGTESSSKKEPSRKRVSFVVPITHKERRSFEMREKDEQDLTTVGEDARLLLDDDRPQTELLPSYSRPVPVVRSGGTKIGNFIENNPFVFMGIAVVAIYVLHSASGARIIVDADIGLLAVFASFCLGLHTPRPLVGGFDRPPTMKATFKQDASGRKLLRRSMMVSAKASRKSSVGMSMSEAASVAVEELQAEVEEEDLIMGSPMPMFPEDAEIGSHFNCYSNPVADVFHVRGPDYFSDRKKVASGDYIFPCRGVDLFLTDTCPENVGRNAGIFGGNLRDKPSFVLNFRLPWGVLLCYFEIPELFIPFVKAGYEPDFDKSKLPSLQKMSPAERTVCRFLMNDADHKKHTFKIVPMVVDGPWIVRQVVGGKPAIIGKKLPVNYVYQPTEGDKALYLEADLDVAASSAARRIVSVIRPYTNVLTIDLGFVVQSEKNDELPEQMLIGVRLHGVDPLTAPNFPPTEADALFMDTSQDDDSVTPPAKQ